MANCPTSLLRDLLPIVTNVKALEMTVKERSNFAFIEEVELDDVLSGMPQLEKVGGGMDMDMGMVQPLSGEKFRSYSASLGLHPLIQLAETPLQVSLHARDDYRLSWPGPEHRALEVHFPKVTFSFHQGEVSFM